MADELENIVLRFSAQDDEGKDALRDFFTLLKALDSEEAHPEVDLKGVGEAELDLGKLIALLRAVGGITAEPVIRPKTVEGRKAIEKFADIMREFDDFEADIRFKVDNTEIKEAEDQVKRLQKKLNRQKKNLADFSGSDQFTKAGGKVRASRIRVTTTELEKATELLQKLKLEASQGVGEVKLSTLQARAALELLRRHLLEMEKLVVSPELKLDDKQALKAAARIHAVMQEITRLKSTAEVDIHSEKFQLKLRELKAEMLSLQAELIKPKLELQGGEATKADIKEITALMTILGAMEADPSMDLHGAAKTLGEVGAVLVALNELEEHANVDIEIHTKGRIESLGGPLGALKHAFGEAQEAATGFAGSIGRVGVSFGPFAARLGPALIAVLALIGSYVLLLVGALAALASSFILAVGAVAAFAAALAAMAGPAVILFIALATRLTAILQALQARQQARLAGQAQAVAGDQQRVASLRAIADATENLDHAQERLKDATLDANREMQDSYERVRDAVRGLEHAELDRDRSKLGTQRAILELDKLRNKVGATGKDIQKMFKRFTDVDVQFDPKQLAKMMKSAGLATSKEDELDIADAILDVREAKLREKDATDAIRDSEVELKRARQDNLEFIKQGIKASDSYRAALDAVADANKALSRAHEDEKMLAAQAKSIALTQQLDKEEQKVLHTFEKIRDAFRKSLKPTIDPIWNALIDTLGGLPGLLTAIAPGMKILGQAVGLMIRALGNAIINPKTLKAFNVFALGAAKLTGPVTRGLVALFDIFIEIAKAAMPFLLEMADQFADKLEEWAKWSGEGTNMKDVIQVMVDNLKLWLDIAFQLIRVFIGFLSSAEAPGRKLATALRDSLKHLADLLADPDKRKELTDWLEHARSTAEKTAEAIKSIVVNLGKIAPTVDTIFTSFTNLFLFFTNNLPIITDLANPAAAAIRGIKGAFQSLWDWLHGKSLKEAIDENFGGVFEAFEKLPGKFFKLGGDIIDGLIDGMVGWFEARKPDIDGIFDSIIKSAGGIFKLGSPSKVFIGIGEQLTAGLVIGMSGMSKAVDAHLRVPNIRVSGAVGGGQFQTAAAGAGATTIQENKFFVSSPAGTAPDEETFIAQVNSRLRKLTP